MISLMDVTAVSIPLYVMHLMKRELLSLDRQ